MPTLDGVNYNGLLYQLAGSGGDTPQDELLGALPHAVTETGCYIISNTNATITTGDSMTDYMDYTRDDYTKNAFVGNASNSATTTIINANKINLTMTQAGSDKGGSCIAQGYTIPVGTYTVFARITDMTAGMSFEPLIRVINNGGASQVSLDTASPNTWGHFGLSGSYNRFERS